MAWPSSAPSRAKASLPKAFVSAPLGAALPTLASLGGLPGPRARGSFSFEDSMLARGPDQDPQQLAAARDRLAVEAALKLTTGDFFHATEEYLKILATDPNSLVALRGIQAVRSGASSPDNSLEGDPATLKRNLLDDLSREAEDAQNAGRFQEAISAANLYFRIPNEENRETERVRQILSASQAFIERGPVSPQLTVNPPEREPAEELD